MNETVVTNEDQSDGIVTVENNDEDVEATNVIANIDKVDNEDNILKIKDSDCEKLSDENNEGSIYYIEDTTNWITYKDTLILKFQSKNPVEKAYVLIYKGSYENWMDYWKWIDVDLGDDGYYTLKVNLNPGEYSIDIHDYYTNDYLISSYVNVRPDYGPTGYTNMKIIGTKFYYDQNKDIYCSWDGIFNGYLKIFKGKTLIDKMRLDNRDEGAIWPGGYESYYIWGLPVGTYSAKIVDMSGKVVAQSTIKILKTPTKIKVKSIKVKPGSKKYIIAKVYEKSCGEKHWSGKVKFKIMGKIYKVKVKKGIAKIKIKIPSKIKTYTCRATFLGDKSAKKSSTKFKITAQYPSNKKTTSIKKKTIKFNLIVPTELNKKYVKHYGRYSVKTYKYIEYGYHKKTAILKTFVLKDGKRFTGYDVKYYYHYSFGGGSVSYTKNAGYGFKDVPDTFYNIIHIDWVKVTVWI